MACKADSTLICIISGHNRKKIPNKFVKISYLAFVIVVIAGRTRGENYKSNEINRSAIGGENSKSFPKFGDRILPRAGITKISHNSTSAGQNYRENDDLDILTNSVDPLSNITSISDRLTYKTSGFDEEVYHNTSKNGSDMLSSLKADRLVEMSTEFFVIPSTTTPYSIKKPLKSTVNPILILAARQPPNATRSGRLESHFGFRKEPWVIVILGLASVAMLLMAIFEGYVLYKALKTCPSRRHLFLGQMLLLGLFASSGLAAILTASPTPISCGVVRFGVGLAYAVVFATLLVKCVFLISLNSGVYLPATYQGLLLFFAVFIQVVIGVQWLISQPPSVKVISPRLLMLPANPNITISSGGVGEVGAAPVCRTPFPNLLMSLTYIMMLLIFVAILAIKSRGIRDNYREATYIGLAISGAIPIWFAWSLCGLTVGDQHKDGCLAFGLVATSATVFLVMFMPKGRQLAAMGREGVYMEDREEQFSSLSRDGSGYSPSFFHFKPVKYGVMTSTSTIETSSDKNNLGVKHHQGTGVGATTGAAVPAPGRGGRADDANLYTSLEPTPSSNPNVYFHRSGSVHPGMMY